MTQILEILTESGESVLVEIREDISQERRASAGTLINKSAETLEALLGRVRPLATCAVQAMRGVRADEITLEVGVSLTVEGGVIFATTATEGNFKISLTWKYRESPANASRG